jgi:hypothetical protein
MVTFFVYASVSREGTGCSDLEPYSERLQTFRKRLLTRAMNVVRAALPLPVVNTTAG